MNLDRAIEILRANEAALRARGVLHAAIFGSLARGEAREGSDVDVLVELDKDATPRGFRYFGLLDEVQELLSHALDCDVDVVAPPVENPRLQEAIRKEAVPAF